MKLEQFAPPSDAIGQAARTVDGDGIPPGLHWRVTLGPRYRMPAGPIVLRRCELSASHFRPSRDIRSSRSLPADVTADRSLALFPVPMHGYRPFWLEVCGGGELRVAVVGSTLARTGAPIELAAVEAPPYRIGSGALSTILVTGRGQVDGVVVWYLSSSAELNLANMHSVDAVPDEFLTQSGVDGQGEHPLSRLYARNSHNRYANVEARILAGAPTQRLPYSPFLEGPDHSSDFELYRVSTLTGGEHSVAAWLHHAAVFAANGDDDIIEVPHAVPGTPPLSARHRAADSLHLAAMDPGVSRWLGRSGTLDEAMLGGATANSVPCTGAGGEAAEFSTGGLELFIAQVAGLVVGEPTMVSDKNDNGGEEYDEALEDGWGQLHAAIETAYASGTARWHAELLNVPIAFSMDSIAARPSPPTVSLAGDPSWFVEEATGALAWRQTIALGGLAPARPVSLEQVGPGGRRTLHPIVDDGVAAPMIVASPQSGGPPSVSASVPVVGTEPPAEVIWRVRLGDWTGRWSDPALIAGAPPPRPRPPAPTIEAWYVPSTDPLPAGPVSTGTVRVAIRVTPSGTPAALPIRRIVWSVDSDEREWVLPLDALQPAGLRRIEDVSAPPTRPGGSRRLRITAVAIDEDGTESDEVVIAPMFADPRPLPAPRIAPRLFPTSRPTADPEVSITLTATGLEEGTAIRFMFANETAVRAALGLDDPGFRDRPRWERAAVLRERGGGPASAYSQALPAPVPAPTGSATETLRFPAGSNDLILVRALPVALSTDAAGVERETSSTPFEATEPAFVVVPTREVPGLPSVTATADRDGWVTVEVRVPDVDTRRFGGAPLEARIVQVVEGAVPDYWPEVVTTVLDRAAAGERIGTVRIGGPRWARVGLAASVRFPPEPLVAADAVIPTGDLVAAGPAAAAETVRSPWGPVAVPAWIDVPGPEPSLDARIEEDGTWRITIRDLPPARPTQRGFLAEIYRGGDALVHDVTVPVDADSAEVALGPFPGEAGAVVLVDPFGVRRAPRMLRR